MSLNQKIKNILQLILKKENFFFFSLAITLFVFDRYTKSIILNNFSDNAYYINDFINFNLVWNTGIGFGLFHSSSDLIYNIISLLIACVIVFLITITIKSEKFDKIIFSTIIGGAMGNFYDRLIFKAVPDFIDLHYENFHWFTFNVADIFITVGIISFLIKGVFLDNK